MLTIRLPKEIEDRLVELGVRSGQGVNALVLQAILAHLEDLEDYHLAAEAWAEFNASGEDTISAQDLGQSLDPQE